MVNLEELLIELRFKTANELSSILFYFKNIHILQSFETENIW